MKRLVTLLILTVVSMAFSYETLTIFSGSHDQTMVCEESTPESGEQQQTKSEKDVDNDQFFGQRAFHRLTTSLADLTTSHLDIEHIFSSSDYGAEIYSPPEFLS